MSDTFEGVDDQIDDDVDDDIGNRVEGGKTRAVLEYLARAIVDDQESVVIETDQTRRGKLDISVHVAPDDMGKLIGRRGRVAQAIRGVVRAVGNTEGVEARVDFVD